MEAAHEFRPNVINFNFHYIARNQPFLVLLVFFCSCVLLVISFILHLITRFSRQITPTSSNPAGPVHPTITFGLDAETINSMPIFLHMAGIEEEEEEEEDHRDPDECSICLGKFENGEKVKVMPECLHAYHSECLDKWLRKRSSCPLCRSSIDSTSTAESSTTAAP